MYLLQTSFEIPDISIRRLLANSKLFERRSLGSGVDDGFAKGRFEFHHLGFKSNNFIRLGGEFLICLLQLWRVRNERKSTLKSNDVPVLVDLPEIFHHHGIP